MPAHPGLHKDGVRGALTLEFWKRVGVTQSGGSRYESGRNIPRPVQLLLTLVYGTDMQVEKLSVALHDWKKKEG